MKIISRTTVTSILLLALPAFFFTGHSPAEEPNIIQKPGKLESINRKKTIMKGPPMCRDNKYWGVVASFTLPGNYPRGKWLETLPNGDIIVAWTESGDGYLGRFSHNDYSRVLWKKKLKSDHIVYLAADPGGKTLALSFSAVRAKIYYVEIRNAKTGDIVHRVRHGIDKEEEECEDEENAGQSAWDMVYSPNGKFIAVNFKYSGGDCTKRMKPHIGLIDVKKGKVVSVSYYDRYIRQWGKTMIFWLPMAFDKRGKYLYFCGPGGIVARLRVKGLKFDRVYDYRKQMIHIIEKKLKENLHRYVLKLTGLLVEPRGSLKIIYGGQGLGTIFSTSRNRKRLYYYTSTEGADDRIYYSRDRSLFMVNYSRINLWNIKTKRIMFYHYGRHARNLTRFHPKKRAIIYVDDKNIAIISRMKTSRKRIGSSFTATGHFLNAKSDFSVRGPGKILWAYGDYEIYHLYAKKDEVSTGIARLGEHTSVYNNKSVIKKTVSLRLKTTVPGMFTICGGTKKPMTNAEILRSIPGWSKTITREF